MFESFKINMNKNVLQLNVLFFILFFIMLAHSKARESVAIAHNSELKWDPYMLSNELKFLFK